MLSNLMLSLEISRNPWVLTLGSDPPPQKLLIKWQDLPYLLGGQEEVLSIPQSQMKGNSKIWGDREEGRIASGSPVSYGTCLQVHTSAANGRECQGTILRSALWELRNKEQCPFWSFLHNEKASSMFDTAPLRLVPSRCSDFSEGRRPTSLLSNSSTFLPFHLSSLLKVAETIAPIEGRGNELSLRLKF